MELIQKYAKLDTAAMLAASAMETVAGWVEDNDPSTARLLRKEAASLHAVREECERDIVEAFAAR